jgi:hypothetical protein
MAAIAGALSPRSSGKRAMDVEEGFLFARLSSHLVT